MKSFMDDRTKKKILLPLMDRLGHLLFHKGSRVSQVWDRLTEINTGSSKDNVKYLKELIEVIPGSRGKYPKDFTDSAYQVCKEIDNKLAKYFSEHPDEIYVIRLVDKIHIGLKVRGGKASAEKNAVQFLEKALYDKPLDVASGIPKVTELFQMYETFKRLVKRSIVREISLLSPGEFSYFARQILYAYGFKNIEVTLDNDNVLCGNATYDSLLKSVRIYFECNRSVRQFIGKKEVEKFRSRIKGKDTVGFFLTTARLTSDAKKDRYRESVPPVILADGASIAEMATDRHGRERQTIELSLYTAVVTKAKKLLKRKPDSSYLN
jgi:restriction endonuclease